MTDDEPKVPVLCPDCETTSRVSLSAVAESIDRHNAQLHDGDEVAQVDPDIADQLANIVAEDMDLL